MNCRKALNLVEQVMEASLRESETVTWQAHIESCASCREQVHEDHRITTALSALREFPEVPDGLHSRVVLALKSKDRWREMAHRAAKRRLVRGVLAAGTATALGIVGWISYKAGIKSAESTISIVQHPDQERPTGLAPPTTEAPVKQGTPVRSPQPDHRAPVAMRPRQPFRVATLVAVTGGVSKRDDRHDWVPAARGSGVRVGELFRTRASSNAILKLHDASAVELKANSVIQVRRGCLALFAGKVSASVRPQRTHFVIITPAARIRVLGTCFSVAVEREGSVRVAVWRGAVQLSNRMGSVKVRTGEEAVAGIGSAPVVLPRKAPAGASSMINIHAEAARPGRIFEVDKGSPVFNIVVDYNEAPFQSLTLHGAVKNRQGELVTEIQESMATERFRHTRRPVTIPVTKPGEYQVRFWTKTKDGIAETTSTFTVRGQNETLPKVQ